MKNKTLKFVLCMLALVAILVVALVLFFKGDSSQEPVSIFNPAYLGADKNVQSADERRQEQEARPTAAPEDIEKLDETLIRKMSALDFNGMVDYVRSQEYNTGDRGVAIRSDISKTLNMTEFNASAVLGSYQTPEVLAAAIAYLPVDYKLDAFINVDSIAFPAETKNIDLKPSEFSKDELKMKLDSINEGRISYETFDEIVCFDVTIYGLPCRLWEVKNGDGWRPYLLEKQKNYSHGTICIREAQLLKESIYKNRATLEQSMYMQRFDLNAYLQDMKEHPENYNSDYSIKPSVFESGS